MSLRGKDLRLEIDATLHERLRIMAEFHDSDVSQLGARLIEKAICGEFHGFTILAASLARAGIVRKVAEGGGNPVEGSLAPVK